MITYADVVSSTIEVPVVDTQLMFVEDTSLEFVGGGNITNVY